MIILGIETSCDETASSLVENGNKVLSNVIASSIKTHIKTGGIIPENAAREQINSIIPVIKKSFYIGNNKIDIKNIDAVAVTVGPGLIGSLLVGVETAKTLSYLWQKPIIPVNHLSAHIYANFLDKNKVLFPAVCLIVSGGHTDLIIIKNHSDYIYLGGTRDDAAGEAFDKCARLLCLSYPGGPSISKAASLYIKKVNKIHKPFLPRPMIREDNFDFSFSGLKTAVIREYKKGDEVNLFAYEIQEAIVDVLSEKTLRAVKKYKPKSLLLAGGVSANHRLREVIKEKLISEKINVEYLPLNPKYSTDNAAIVASCAFYNFNPIKYDQVEANPQLTILDRL